jgi:nucleotide-binding universal stress UspA family protein
MDRDSILVATDLTEGSAAAIFWAHDAAAAMRCSVVVAHFVDLSQRTWTPCSRVGDSMVFAVKRLREQVVSQYRTLTGSAPDAAEVRVAPLEVGLGELADAYGVGMVVVAESHHTKLGHLMGRSRVDQLITAPPCPVVVVHPGGDPRDPGLCIAAALDLGPESEDVVDFAAKLAMAFRRPLDLVHIEPPLWGRESAVDRYRDVMERMEELRTRAHLELVGHEVRLVIGEGSSVDLLTRVESDRAKLVFVMGATHLEGGVEGLLRGFPTRFLREHQATVAVVPALSIPGGSTPPP